jgi:hypothetical protein
MSGPQSGLAVRRRRSFGPGAEALAKAGNNIGGISCKSVTYRWWFCDLAIKVEGIY